MMLKVLRFISLFFLCIILSDCVKNNDLDEGIHQFQLQNYREAFIRLKPLADHGQPDAEYAIGYMYYYGEGVTEDRRRAWYWINHAAKKGQVDAIRAVKLLSKK